MRRPLIVLANVSLVLLSYVAAYFARFDFAPPEHALAPLVRSIPILLVIRLAVFAWYRLYVGLWRYTSIGDIVDILKAVSVGSLLFVATCTFVGPAGVPRSVFLLDWIFCLGLLTGLRLSVRAFRESRRRTTDHRGQGESVRTLVIGAGDAADELIRAIQTGVVPNNEVVGLVEDDVRKLRSRIRGVPVIGAVEMIPDLVSHYAIEEVLLAVPSATVEQRRKIVELCRQSGVVVKTVPSLERLIERRAAIDELEEVEAEDLLGRERVKVDLDGLRGELGGKTVLVTGAAGSIGSEICRQVAAFEPKRLIMLERAESSLYFAHLDLEARYPALDVVPAIGDICDTSRVHELMAEHKPDVVYHAAAYKHVPLMEAMPLDAIKNNLFGTEIVARAAIAHDVGKFIFISTDKAVAPVGVMGMTKRAAEGFLLSLPPGPTTFASVRFGNVLGSDGSILPLFRWQLASGRPLTVTHQEATRYFMLVSEAAQLVLNAGLMAREGEVYFLEMGEPVKIMRLAEDFARLSGKRPGLDVDIQVVGLRPGERLAEELVQDTERLHPTSHEKISMCEKPTFDRAEFDRQLDVLRYNVEQRDSASALVALKTLVTLY